MKKLILTVVLMLVALPVWGATFPTADNHTLVSADASGLVTVQVTGETDGWYLVQYCQDDLAAGCGNKFSVQPNSVTSTSMTFQLDMSAVKDGAVAYNFRRKCDDKWLAIPDCRVKAGSNIGMGMSYFSKDREESGGAHFVYKASGIQPWSPIDASKWCDESAAINKGNAVVQKSNNWGSTVRSGGSDNSIGHMNNNRESAVAKEGAVAVNKSTDVAAAGTKIVQKPKIVIKGKGHKVGNISQVTQATGSIVIKGHGNNVRINFGTDGQPVYDHTCNACHNNGAWTMKNYSGTRKTSKTSVAPSNVAPVNNIKPGVAPKGKTYLDGTQRGSGK
jgi:hypothetical protein